MFGTLGHSRFYAQFRARPSFTYCNNSKYSGTKIEEHYHTKTTLLLYRLDQFHYEQTLNKFTTSAFSGKSAQSQKTNVGTLNVDTDKISQRYERTDTILKIRLYMRQSCSPER